MSSLRSQRPHAIGLETAFELARTRAMDHDALITYLDDHLAGAQAALALLERLDTHPNDGLDVASLRRDIDDDRVALERVVASLGDQPSRVKRAAGWIAGKLSQPKLGDGAALGRFEALEVLSLGILGKSALWRTLAEIGGVGRLDARSLEDLQRRALDQHERVERARLAWARRTFLAPPPDEERSR